MKKANQICSGCAMAVSYAAFVSWLFCISQLEAEFTHIGIAPHLLALFYIAVYLFNCFLTNKSAPLALYVGIQMILGAAAIGLFLLTAIMEPFSTGVLIFMGIFLVAGVFGCGYAADETLGAKNLIFYFDAMVVLLIVLMLADHLLELMLVQPVMYICFAAIALSLFSLFSLRVSQEKAAMGTQGAPLAGRILVVAMLAVVLLLAFGLTAFGASGTQSLSEALFNLLKWCITTLKHLGTTCLNVLERFLTWLLSFLPEEQYDTLEGGLDAAAMEISYESSGMPIPKWIFYIAAALAALWLLKFFLSMLKERVGEGNQARHTVTQSTRSGTLLSGLKELLSCIMRKVTYHIACIRNRKTPPGLLLWCEKHVPKTMRRKQDESGPAFLLRLSRLNLPGDQKEALVELGTALERSFYSPSPIPISPELYKRVHRCKF